MLAARAEVCYRGDLNLDGSVDGNDVSILLEVVLAGSPQVLYEYVTLYVDASTITLADCADVARNQRNLRNLREISAR